MNLKRLSPVYSMSDGGEGGGGGEASGDKPVFSEEYAGYAESKGFKSADDAIRAARESEQFISRSTEGRTLDHYLERPNPDKPETVDNFYKALGRPDAPDGYEGIEIGENKMTPKSDEWFKGVAHKYNLTARS